MQQSTRKLLPLLLLIFIDSFSYFIVIPVLLQLFFNHQYHLIPDASSLRQRELLTGFVIGLSSLATLISAPLIGHFSDQYGRKKTLGVCLFLVCLGFLLPILGILSQQVLLIIFGRFLTGLGSASQAIAQAAVSDIYKSRKKSQALSLIALMMTLPIILGPLAGGYLSDPKILFWFDIKTPYLFALLLSLFNFLLLILFFKETLKNSFIKKNQKQAQKQAKNTHLTLTIFNLFWQLKTSIKLYSIGLLLFLFFSLELGWSSYYQTIPLYLSQSFFYSAQKISLFYTYMGLLISLGLILIYPILIRFFPIKKIMQTSWVLVIFTLFLNLILSYYFKNPEIQWVLSPIISIFTGMAYVSLVSLISDKVPENQQGWIMGYLSTLLFFAWMLTGFMSGVLV